MISLVSVLAVFGGVFLAVLSVVALVKVLQIAEDVRAIRAKGDSTIKKPMPYWMILLICAGAALLLLFIVAGYAGSGVKVSPITW